MDDFDLIDLHVDIRIITAKVFYAMSDPFSDVDQRFLIEEDMSSPWIRPAHKVWVCVVVQCMEFFGYDVHDVEEWRCFFNDLIFVLNLPTKPNRLLVEAGSVRDKFTEYHDAGLQQGVLQRLATRPITDSAEVIQYEGTLEFLDRES